MNTFGKILSSVEHVLLKNYGKDGFKNHLKEFRNNIIKNRNLSETYFLYTELSKKKGFSKEFAEEYLNTSIEKIKENIKKEEKNIKTLIEWVNNINNDDVKNDYQDIDRLVYDKGGVKNIEKLIESKIKIQSIISDKDIVKETKSINIPLSSMVTIVEKTINKKISTLTESKQKEIKEILSLNKSDLKTQILEKRETVIKKLQLTINESADEELNNKISKTIEKLNNSNISPLTLYRIKELEKGI